MQFITTPYAHNIDGKTIQPMIPLPLSDIDAMNLKDKCNAEISDNPKIFLKKYYVGCLKDGDKLLVRRAGGIGDVIWTLPTIKLIKESYPNVIIKYALRKEQKGLLDNIKYIDEVIYDADLNMNLVNWCDWILDYFYSVEGYSVAESIDPYDISFDWAFNGMPKNLNIYDVLELTDAEKEWAKSIVKNKTIAVCMQSSSPKRSYPYIEALVNELTKKYDYDVLLMGDRQYKTNNTKVIDMIGKTNLRQMMSLLWAVDYGISVDSGNMHLLGQFKKPSIALFSSVDSKTRVKYYPEMKAINCGRWCSPCHQIAEHCPIHGECMSLISVDMILKEFDKIKG